MKTVIIYSIKNKVNSKTYIGKSSEFDKRISMHFYNASKGMKTPLYEDVRLYGRQQFEITILDSIEVEHFTDAAANDLEQTYIKSVPKELRYNVMVRDERVNNSLVDKLKPKKIIAINVSTGDTLEFDSTYKAAIHFTGSRNTGSITPILQGKKKTLYGFTFKYAE